MTHDDALELFRRSGALLCGHFRLSSGLHSDQYLEKFRLVENPRYLEPMCEAIAARFAGDRVEYVLGPTTAGIILAYAVARCLGTEARYAEPVERGRDLRRGQSLRRDARVLIVDDILTTGLSVSECVSVVQCRGAQVVGIGVLADRSGGSAVFAARVSALVTMDVPAYAPDRCPNCARGEELTQRGSRKSV
jgi:orotate phosphoribosyltransferase